MELNPAEEENRSGRMAILFTFTQNPHVVQELIDYTKNQFLSSTKDREGPLEIPEELHVADWRRYALAAQTQGALPVLKEPFVQLNFPVREGMSMNENYRKASFKGLQIAGMPEAQGIQLDEPEKLRIVFIDGPVGKLPALIAHHPRDFELLFQSFFYRNEPVPIPSAMGASIVKGVNNWARLRKVFSEFRSRNSFRSAQSIFAEINQKKQLYQDTFVLISKKPYSNVWPRNYDHQKWQEASVKIRMWHEYAHYFTSRYFETMQNNIHDELLADYLGIHAVKPIFDAQLFLLFLGLERHPTYRTGGRFENYLGEPKLSTEAKKVLQTLVIKAAHQVESFDKYLGDSPDRNDLFRRLIAIASIHIEEIAAPNGLKRLVDLYSHR